MKNIFLIAMAVILMAIPASAGMKYADVFTAEALEAGGTATSSAIDMLTSQIQGYFSLQLTITGDGTAKIEYECSNDGTTYDEPQDASDLFTGLVKTSGPGADGKLIDQFELEICRFVRFVVTETGGVSAVTVTAKLIAQ